MPATDTCTFEADHPGIAAPDDLPTDAGYTETCDRPASVLMAVRDEYVGDLVTERLCDGHATRLRVEIATGELLGVVIETERPIDAATV